MEAFAKLGINWMSVLTYLINIGLLIIVLTYVLYKPLLKFLDERRKQISDSIHEAEVLRKEFTKQMAENEATQKESEQKLREEMDNLRKFTEEKRAQLVSEMETARAEMMMKADAEIEKKKAGLLKDAEQQILDLMKKIVLDIVQHKIPENVVQESIKDGWKQYNKK